jgi:hypothetical protein
VTGNWKELERDTISLPGAEEKETPEKQGILVVWTRDIYHEWEILSCNLPLQHEGKHAGGKHIVYSLLNTVTEKKVYGPDANIVPPTPHFTDGMPQQDLLEDEIVTPDELPSETIK